MRRALPLSHVPANDIIFNTVLFWSVCDFCFLLCISFNYTNIRCFTTNILRQCQQSISNVSTTRFWVKQMKERKRVCINASCSPKGSGICGHNIQIHISLWRLYIDRPAQNHTLLPLFILFHFILPLLRRLSGCVLCAFGHVPLRGSPPYPRQLIGS